MLEITNVKVETLDPKWARFVGYSLLFDNPGKSLLRTGRLEKIDGNVESSVELPLYRELSRAISELKRDEPSELGLCLLPPGSYHVTFFDCGNQANADGAHPESKPSLIRLIEGLPDSWSEEHELVLPAARSSVALASSLNIGFRYSHLKNWNNEVIVAVLEPIDMASATKLERLVEERAKLSNSFRTTFGFGAGPRYTPHVSLAYFANKEGGHRATEKTEEWDNALRRRTEDLRIHFNSISGYAFTDMASFFREPRGGPSSSE